METNIQATKAVANRNDVKTGPRRRLLYIDMAYTYEMIQAKRHYEFMDSRHSGGYFEKVWAVHPIADIPTGRRTGFQVHTYTPSQTIIEGAAELKPWPRALMPLNFIFSQYQLFKYLVRLIEENNISVIAATDPFYGGLLGLWLKRKCKRPLSIFVYGNYDDIYSEKKQLAMPKLLPWRSLEVAVSRKVFRNSDLVVGGTKNYVDYARNNGAENKLCMVSPFSKNMSQFHLRPVEQREPAEEAFERLGIPPGRTYLILVARLIDPKHPADVLKAMKIVMEKEPSVIGIFAGDGHLRQELEALATELGIRENVKFTGNIDQKTLSQIVPKCIALSPSTGMALVECGLGGAPAVAYNRDWQPEFIDDGVNGFIVGFRDYKALGEKALEIVQNPELRARLSKNMRQRALDYADAETLYANEHAVFEKMFSNFEKENG